MWVRMMMTVMLEFLNCEAGLWEKERPAIQPIVLLIVVERDGNKEHMAWSVC